MATPEVEVLEASKNGGVVTFKLFVDGSRELIREEEDFSWLLHCIRTETHENGIIYPPMPKIGASDAREAERRAREQYGSGANIVGTDALTYECRQIERFMKMLLRHPTISGTRALADFLSQEAAPPRVPVKTNRVVKWGAAVSEKMKASYKDISPFFEDERKKTGANLVKYRSCNTQFKKMSSCLHRLAVAEREVANEGAGDSGTNEELRGKLRRVSAVFSKAATNVAFVNETMAEELCRTIGRFLELYEGFHDNLREALYKRTLLLIAYQDSQKALEKAKPDRKSAIEEVRVVKEKEFQDFSLELKEEIVRFHRARVEAAHHAVVQVARAATKAAVDRHALMAQELNLLKNFDV